jgi:hypothetical protein
MKTHQLFLVSIIVVFAGITNASASSAQRPACSVLTLAEVRAIVSGPVTIFEPGSSAPTVRGDTTFSTCTYTIPKGTGRSATVTLMWAPKAKLASTKEFYEKRGEIPSLKGDMLVLTTVVQVSKDGMTPDRPVNKKLLAAVLQKL